MSPAVITAGGAGGSGRVTVTAASNKCAWTIDTGDAGWIALSAKTRKGTSAVDWSVRPNITGATRSATVTIAGIDVSVTQTATALSLKPTEHLESYGARRSTFKTACLNLASWPTVGSRTTFLANADWSVNMMTDGEQRTCFSNLATVGITIGLEVGVLKPGADCRSARGCFRAGRTLWDRMVKNGARIGVFFLDEPLHAVVSGMVAGDVDYAINQTRAFADLIRARYPDARIVDIEPFPTQDDRALGAWIDALGCCNGTPAVDYIEVDHDWARALDVDPLVSLKDRAHAAGLGFGLILWGASVATSFDDQGWFDAVTLQANAYRVKGLVADLYDYSSWLEGPSIIVPDDRPLTFMYAISKVIANGDIVYPSIDTGRGLAPDQSVRSPDGRFQLVYQRDGDLVLYGPDRVRVWSSGTEGETAGRAIMDAGGDFVVYDADGSEVWSAGSGSHPGSYLVVQNDGRVVVYAPGYVVLWTSDPDGLLASALY
ncbi:MAG: hypothetical protein HY048_07275 [Acidobacteria bacterium]|nr:hypothetical protein [Acidobacteriota bacterium]